MTRTRSASSARGARGRPSTIGVADADRHPHRHHGQGAGGRQRRVHQRAQGDHRDLAAALAALSVLQHAGAAHRGRLHPGPRARVGGQGAAREAAGEHPLLSRGHDPAGVRHKARHPPHRAHHAGRRHPGHPLRRRVAGQGGLRGGVQLPGGSPGQGPHPGAGLGGPLARGPGLRGRDVRPDHARSCWAEQRAGAAQGPQVFAQVHHGRAGWPRTAARSRPAAPARRGGPAPARPASGRISHLASHAPAHAAPARVGPARCRVSARFWAASCSPAAGSAWARCSMRRTSRWVRRVELGLSRNSL